MAKYRKKPVTIEAIQYKGNNPTEIHDFVRKHMFRDIDGNLSIHTLEGDMKASIGDYIIRGVDGEFYPCKPDIFKKTYEKINIQPNNSTVNKQELAYRFLELPYLIKNVNDDLKSINNIQCIKDFDKFLELHNKEILRLQGLENNISSMGI